MPQLDERFRRRSIRMVVFAVVAPIIIFLGGLTAGKNLAMPWLVEDSLTVAGILFAVTICVLLLKISNYRCPQCGKKIATDRKWKPDEPIVYYCPECKIEWDTGARGGSDND